MSRVDELQERHDKLLAELEGAIKIACAKESRDYILSLVNQYGNTCIKLVEAEHAECGS